MWNKLTCARRSGAPLMRESLAGAPLMHESLAGAPPMYESLAGAPSIHESLAGAWGIPEYVPPIRRWTFKAKFYLLGGPAADKCRPSVCRESKWGQQRRTDSVRGVCADALWLGCFMAGMFYGWDVLWLRCFIAEMFVAGMFVAGMFMTGMFMAGMFVAEMLMAEMFMVKYGGRWRK